MSLSFEKGRIIAVVKGGDLSGKLLSIVDPYDKKKGATIGTTINVSKQKGELIPTMNLDERAVEYIAGPSGSGKTTMAVLLANKYLKVHPEINFYLFSRTAWTDDPAFKKLKKPPIQIPINENLLFDPIDISTELAGGSLVLFDDITTIQNDKLKKVVQGLVCDILEVGRKLNINIILTNHLICPNEKSFARTILNEIQVMTIFPKSGSSQQIRYCLSTYFGLEKQQIDDILKLPSRWVRICRTYPQYVLYSGGAYIL